LKKTPGKFSEAGFADNAVWGIFLVWGVNCTAPTVTKSNDTTVCAGSAVPLLAGGGISYKWTDSTSLSCGSCPNPTATPKKATTYYVNVTNASGCSALDSVHVNMLAALPAKAGNPDSICLGASTNLLAKGGSSYTWSPATGLSCTNCANPVANPTVSTTYTVNVTGAGGCPAKDSVRITVTDYPVASISPAVTICIGGKANLSAGGGSSYSWSPAAGLSSTTSANPTANPAATTLYMVSISNAGCTVKDSVLVRVAGHLPVSAGADSSFCIGDSIQLSGTGASIYAWTPAAGLSCVNCANPVAKPTVTTSYILTGTDASGLCVGKDTIVVTVNKDPIPFINKDTTIVLGTSAQLRISGGMNYLWSPSSSLSSSSASRPLATPSVSTHYRVLITDSNGCKSIDTVTVFVDVVCLDPYIPTAFSPNGDGENDVYFIRGNCFETFDLSIFDRWGEVVFRSTDQHVGWDGRFNGKPMNTAVFAYVFNATLTNGKQVSKKGNITLLR